MNEVMTYAAALVVLVLASGRLTRLVVQDSFPPSVWLRIKWDEWTEGSSWNLLLHCHWCFSVWATAIVGVWGWATDLHWHWWALFGWLAASYVVAMIVERDEKEV